VTIPALAGLSGTYFVSLTLSRGSSTVSRNFYWLSRRAEIIDFEHADWYHAPTAQYADFTALAALPQVTLRASAVSQVSGARGTTRVTLENASGSIAFFVRLKLTRGSSGAVVTPALWEDNYVSLVPGEKREIAVTYPVGSSDAAASVELSGWNVARQPL
jgi:exo-1,4-beta-D-glucosaminidase